MNINQGEVVMAKGEIGQYENRGGVDLLQDSVLIQKGFTYLLITTNSINLLRPLDVIPLL